MTERVGTTEALELATPTGQKQWSVERKALGTDSRDPKWDRMVYRDGRARTNGRAPLLRHFPIADLSIETIAARWGPGCYRVIWSNGPGKRPSGKTGEFLVPDDDVDDESAVAPSPPPSPSSSAERPNGNGHARRWLPGEPTALQSPPLGVTAYPTYVSTRDASPLEVFMAMQTLWEKQAAEFRAHEERRSREFQQMMDLRLEIIRADKEVAIAEANARSARDTEHAKRLHDELGEMRDLVREAESAQQGGHDEDLRAALEQIEIALANLIPGEDEEDEESAATALASVAGSIVQQFGPPLAQALSARLAGAASDAGAIPASYTASVKGAVTGDDAG